MTSINVNGVKISPQDLSLIVPTGVDHGRLFNHDGSSSITLHDGTETTTPGIYVWDNDEETWRGLKTNADVLDGKHASDFALDEDLVTHIGDSDNPHGLSVEDIGAIPDQTGVIFKNHLHFDPATQDELDTHIGDSDNPHGVDAGSIGAVPDETGSVSESHLNFDPATQTELDATQSDLDSMQTDLSDHESDTSNPHSVGLGQAASVDSDFGTDVSVNGSSVMHTGGWGKVDVGYFNDGDTKITTGFKPTYVEIISQIHQAGWNSENQPAGAPLGQGHGFASGTASSDQVVVVEGDGSASVNGHASYVGDGEVIHALQTPNDGNGISARSTASISSFDSDGFTLNWTSTGAAAYYIYKAYR